MTKLYEDDGFLGREAKLKNGKIIAETSKKNIEKINKNNYQKCTKDLVLCSNKATKGCLENFNFGSFEQNKIIFITRKGVLVNLSEEITPKGMGDVRVVFVYTNKEYLTDGSIDTNNYYKYVGNYEYKENSDTVKRVMAFKETNIPVCGSRYRFFF